MAIKGVRAVFTPVDVRKVRFGLTEDLGGLRIGDDVRIGGYKVGVVRSIDLDGLDDGQQPSLLITFSLPQKYPLHENAHIGIQTTVTGTSVLNIDNIGSGTLLADSTELTGHPSALSSLLASFSSAGPDLQQIIHDVKTNTLPRVNVAAVKAGDTLDSIHKFAEHASTMSDQVSGLLGDSKTDVSTTLANLHKITSDVKDKEPAILDHANTLLVKANTALDNARVAIEDLKGTLANANDISGTARTVISGNRGKLENIVLSLKAASDNLKGATAEVRRSPWRALYRPGPGEMDNLELYDAARQFADGANNMNDAATALRDATKDPKVDQTRLQKLMNELDASFGSFDTVEQKLWKSVKPE